MGARRGAGHRQPSHLACLDQPIPSLFRPLFRLFFGVLGALLGAPCSRVLNMRDSAEPSLSVLDQIFHLFERLGVSLSRLAHNKAAYQRSCFDVTSLDKSSRTPAFDQRIDRAQPNARRLPGVTVDFRIRHGF